MEKKLNSYETLFVIDSQLSEGEIKALTEKFTGMIAANGTISEVKEWGNRRLAYPINYKTEGYYVLVKFTADANVPAEIDRQMRINDSIVRQMITRI